MGGSTSNNGRLDVSDQPSEFLNMKSMRYKKIDIHDYIKIYSNIPETQIL